MSKTLELTLSSSQQLLSINDDITNFSAKIGVSSKSAAPFQVAVLNEEKLNTLGDKSGIEFKEAAAGVITIEVKNDTNVLENWYLILKSAAENVVTVKIDLIEISPVSLQVPEETKSSSKKKFIWPLIVASIVIAGVVGLFVFKSKGKKESSIELPRSEPIIDEDFLAKISQLPEL